MERHVSLDEDEGFCDSDSTDKAPMLAARGVEEEIAQNDTKHETRKKSTHHKKVSFKNDIDEIPNVDVKINQLLRIVTNTCCIKLQWLIFVFSENFRT